MSAEDTRESVNHLYDLVGAGGVLEGMGGLESTASVIDAESLMPQYELSEEQRPLVERTVAKIVDNELLDRAESFALEAIIIPDKRPAIDVLGDNHFSTQHHLWTHLNKKEPGAKRETEHAAEEDMSRARDPYMVIHEAIPAAGRVELREHPSIPFVGSGFVVGPGLMMTNRHVAEVFTSGLGDRDLVFHSSVSPLFDLERRIDGGSVPIEVRKVLMIHPYWDMALLEVHGLPGTVRPLRLATQPAEAQSELAVIGYPALDPRNDRAVQDEVFRSEYDVKRIMPGKLTGSRKVKVYDRPVASSAYDSSTLGGVSGSVVLNIETGEVAALHFGGRYKVSNYGAPADHLARDRRVVDAGVLFAGTPSPESGPWDAAWAMNETPVSRVAATNHYQSVAKATPQSSTRSVSVTIPVKVTVDIGDMINSATTTNAKPAPMPTGEMDDDLQIDFTEAVPEDFLDREGYDEDFLGIPAPLPRVVRDAADVLSFEFNGKTEAELRYQHFSVVMNEPRRLCFFSATNIDGASSKKRKRVGWRTDPRIPNDKQIIKECYGNPPRFSRGHMTRREDPVWGSDVDATLGNADSMNVTNAVPQMQSFNSPIWLALEDHALDNAREDDMKLCVFTGPYFDTKDPVHFGVQIPVAFWKVIVFIHDQTGQLSATGYEMDQRDHLPSDREFVFGDFVSPQLGVTVQTSLQEIERKSGLSFGDLTLADPKSRFTESLGAQSGRVIERLDQILF